MRFFASPPRSIRALGHRNFRLYFFGQLASWTGTWIQKTAQAWLVFRLTDSPAWLGAVGFASMVPAIVLGPLGGVLADRRRRWPLVVSTQTLSMASAFLLAVLTLTGAVNEWHVLGIALATGCIDSFDIPARQALMVELAGKRDLPNAIALNSFSFNAARLAGPALAGLLVAFAGEGLCFLLNALSFTAVLAGLLRMKIDSVPNEPGDGSLFAHLREGIRFAGKAPPIRSLLLLLALTSLTAAPYIALMPIFAGKILDAGPEGLGLLLSCTGLGALAGGVLLARKESLQGLGGLAGGSALGCGISLALFSLSRSFWLSGALIGCAGFFILTQMVATNTLIQSMAPDRLRGRMVSLYTTIFMGVAPFGHLAAGALAEMLGAPLTLASGGAIASVGGLFFLSRLATFDREAAPLLSPEPPPPLGAPAPERARSGTG